MVQLLLGVLLKVATSDVAKTVIAICINKLLESKGDGVTKDIAEVMIDGIEKSKMNPTTADVFADARKLLVHG